LPVFDASIITKPSMTENDSDQLQTAFGPSLFQWNCKM
jgi:hypothetical protein